MNKLLTSAALLGVMAISATVANAAHADAGKVKCLGIAKAGKNDCKTMNGSHSCAGQSKVDNDMNDWKFADSAEACTKEGGKVAQ